MKTKELIKSSKGCLMVVSTLWEAKIQNTLQTQKQTKQNKQIKIHKTQNFIKNKKKEKSMKIPKTSIKSKNQ